MIPDRAVSSPDGGDPDPERAARRDRAGDDGVAGRLGDAAGLAGDHRLVDVGGAVDDHAVGRDARAGSDEHDVADREVRDRDLLGAGRRDPLGRVRQQRRQGGERALRLRDRAHLEPVAEQHDRDQGRQLPPDLDLEQAEGARPARSRRRR